MLKKTAKKYKSTKNGIRLDPGADPNPAVRTTKNVKTTEQILFGKAH